MILFLHLSIALLLSGCAGVFILGAGVGAGAYSYIAGNLTRDYEAEYQLSVAASTNVMEELDYTRKEESFDELKTVIGGYIYTDTPVTIEVVYVDSERTNIGVRVGYVGVDNLELATQVHDEIAEEIGRLKPRSIGATTRPNLKATAQKRKIESTGDIAAPSEEENDISPEIPEAASVSMESDADDSEEMSGQQETLALFDTESQLEEPAEYAAEVERDVKPQVAETVPGFEEIEVEAAQESAGLQDTQTLFDTASQPEEPAENRAEVERDVTPQASEADAAPMEGDDDDALEARRLQEKLAAFNMERAQEIATDDPAGVDRDGTPQVAETVPGSEEIEVEGAQESAGPQDTQALAATENKTFIYYPESARSIHSGSYGTLVEVISHLENNPSARVDIRAYSASSGKEDDTLDLSRKRVFEIRNYFILIGISEERITGQILEAENSPKDNPSDRLSSLNQRVELSIW